MVSQARGHLNPWIVRAEARRESSRALSWVLQGFYRALQVSFNGDLCFGAFRGIYVASPTGGRLYSPRPGQLNGVLQRFHEVFKGVSKG